MAYIGKQPIVGNYQVLDALTATTTDTYALTKNSVAVFPQTPANCIVSLNGVIQAPFDSYTISGSNIVFASALTGSDSIDFITVLGDVLNVGTVSDGTIGLAKLSATGTKDATTFLRGDNTFASAGGTNTPAFEAYLSANTVVSNATATKVLFNTEVFDTASAYDNATNYRFTVPSGQAGKYYIYSSVMSVTLGGVSTYRFALGRIYLNGVQYREQYISYEDNNGSGIANITNATIDLSVGDYIEIYFYGAASVSTPRLRADNKGTYFGAYKIIE